MTNHDTIASHHRPAGGRARAATRPRGAVTLAAPDAINLFQYARVILIALDSIYGRYQRPQC
ncbi:MAG: hypothetical protein AMXMBFR36_38550 [Acidobacteriota bacterium]